MAYIKKIKLPGKTPGTFTDPYVLRDDEAWHKLGDMNGNITIIAGDKEVIYNPEATNQIIEITASDLKLTEVMRFKGTKAYTEIIALTDAEKGDVWLDNTTGMEYVCVVAKTAGASSWEKLGYDISLEGYVTKVQHNAHKHAVSVTGANAPSNLTASASIAANKVLTGKTKKYLTASANGGAVAVDGTADAITALGTPTIKNALGEDATFTANGGTASKAYIKATASGTALSTNDDTIQPIISVGSPTVVTLPTVTDSSWNFEVDDTTGILTISGENSSHIGGSVTPGSAPTLGTAKTFLTSASVGTQPTITLASDGISGTGKVQYVTDVSAITVSSNVKDTVSAITGFGEHTTETVAKGVKVTAQPTITLSGNTTTSTGAVAYLEDAASAAVSNIEVTGTAAAQTWTVGTITVGNANPQL